MPVLDKSNAADVARYENFIKSSPYGRATQDMNWSQVKNNWESDYVYLEENGEIIAALSILSVEAVDDASFSYASRGPVSDLTDIELTKRLIEEAKPVIEAKNSFLLLNHRNAILLACITTSFYSQQTNNQLIFR